MDTSTHTLDEEDMQEIAKQLRKPSGKNGLEIAKRMDRNNKDMTLNAIALTDILEHNKILELGHGNCGHLPYLIEKNPTINYTGLDISTSMKMEAEHLNHDFVSSGKASYHLYDGTIIPFESRSFDRFFTVNTLYFWEDPEKLMSELHRILKPEGMGVICFAEEQFLKQLPFTQFNFEFYSLDRFQKLAEMAGFVVDTIQEFHDEAESKTGETVNRRYYAVCLKKAV
ncbi:MAG: class I SAM-dependent methyltransferase [Flavobacteriales bacterium]|nr:class I SAM-dependent methyltransferase [Flavobacteriales bacterium]